MVTDWKRAIVIGASGGIGEQIVRKLTSDGCHVALVARNEERIRRIAMDINGVNLDLAKVHPFDVLNIDNVEERFQQIVRDLGGLDLFVYAAGVMPVIDAKEYDSAKDKDIIEINLVGAIAWINEAAKRFEKAKEGTIVGIGSVSGDRGRRGNPAYGASKAGLDCFLESLRNRLGSLGVSVVTVKPGPVQTEMTRPLGKLPGMISANKAADLILKAAHKFNKTVYVPGKWWLVSRVIRAIPSVIFRRLRI